ncbi:hypothetical protein [Campylobacter canadensis]|uniref:hypothetical protein n=1 Tax=Campylobacter canadensis TaxID=449520 RepID=UPI001CCA9E1C|nr:hypothetical protein [Campylobacter canadensis]MBZ8002397.1 hypothetical protein [Campylobacter canadensis]
MKTQNIILLRAINEYSLFKNKYDICNFDCIIHNNEFPNLKQIYQLWKGKK